MTETNNILSILDSYTLNNSDDIAKEIADAFRKRRIEKNLTREQVAEPVRSCCKQYRQVWTEGAYFS